MNLRVWPHDGRRVLARIAYNRLAGLTLIGLCGCSQAPYDMAPAGGAVTIDGMPFTAGKVMFAPIAKGEVRRVGPPALGRLQPDGSFQLSTYQDGDGAVVGEHWVTVIRIDDEANGAVDARIPPFSRLLVPTRSTVVAGQDNRFEVRLTKADILKYGEKGD